MAHESFPNDDHNNRVVTLAEHEQIAVGLGKLSGLLSFSNSPALYADSTGLQIKIPPGISASIRGTRFNNNTTTAVPIGSNTSGKTRVDLVVLRLRRQETSLGAGNQYTVAPYVIQGASGDNPVAPSPVRDSTPGSGYWDVPLAEVTVVHNATTIGVAQLRHRGYWITGSGYTGRDEWGKPPAEPGVIFTAVDSGTTYIGTNSGTWQILYSDSGWVDVPLEAGWARGEGGSAKVRRVNRAIFVDFSIVRTGGSLTGASVLVGKIPNGFQPGPTPLTIPAAVTVSGGACRFVFFPSRDIRVDANAQITSGRGVGFATSWPQST